MITPSRLTSGADTLLNVTAAASLFAMMLLTFTDVIMRYLLNRPIRGSLEITELLMVGMIFAGLPLVSVRDEHVAIDTIEQHFPAAVRRALRRLMHVVCAIALTGTGWLMVRKGATLAEFGDTTQQLRIPLAPFVYFMAALIVVTAFVHVYKAFRPGAADGGGTTVV
jgi:TRAP-type C4-dicarboxylate transport system permease small subunit